MLKYSQTTRNSPQSNPVVATKQAVDHTNNISKSPHENLQQKKPLRRHSSLIKKKADTLLERTRRHTVRGNRRRLSIRAKSSSIQPDTEDADFRSDYAGTKMRKFVQTKNSRPFCNWSTDDLCEWLRVNALDRDDMLAIQFRSSQLNGSQLVIPEAAWEQMGRYTFKDEEHKNEVLSKLAECIRDSREERKSSRTTSPKHQNQRFLQVPSPLSFSRDSVISSSDYASSKSSANPSASSDQDFFNIETTSKASSSSSPRNSKVMKVISNIKGSMAKLRPSASEEDILADNQLQPIVIYTEVDTPGQLAPTELRVTQTTTTAELIQLFLDGSAQTEDINLFSLVEVTLPTTEDKSPKSKTPEPSRKNLEISDCPLTVFKSFTSSKRNVAKRLELIKGKGVMIKVTCRISSHKPRSKQFQITPKLGVDHVIKLALCKFSLFNVDPSLFALCEVTMSGDITELDKPNKKKWQSGSSFLLCDRPSLEEKTKDPVSTNKFFRSTSTTSHISQRSEASSTDSWIPFKLDKKGILNGEIKKSMTPTDSSSTFHSDEGELILDELSPLVNDVSESWSQRRKNSSTLSIENAILRARIQEQDDQMKEVRDKVAEVRRVLENGLQQYHDDALYNNEDNINMNSITFEKELQANEKLINNSENILGQLFRHQRQLLSKKNSPTRSGSIATLEEEVADAAGEVDIELRIASHQADLLATKHKHHVTDMKMSLFVANRKAEKFRHMITGSLYDIIADKRSSLIPTHAQDSSGFHHALHWCEIFPETAGYGLAMKDEKEYRQNGSAKMKGTVLDSDHQQGNLLKGDRLLEVNGINVQTCGSAFVGRVLKETSSARIVVLRKLASEEIQYPKIIQDHEIIPSPIEENSNAMSEHFNNDKFLPGNAETADWREISALQSDLAMLMRELEVTSRAKRDLERDLAVRKNHDLKLENENARLKKQIEELTRRRQTSVDYVSC